MRKQSLRSGESTRLPPMWAVAVGLILAQWHMQVGFVVGSCFAPAEGFSLSSLVFFPSQKQTFQIPVQPG